MDITRKKRFKLLFEGNYQRLCNIAYGYLGERAICEDIVQDTMIAIWNRGKDTLPKGEFAAYATVSVRNNCISYIRKRTVDLIPIDSLTRQAVNLYEDPREDENEKEPPSPSSVLKDMLSILPPRCRTIYVMSKLNKMKYRDIAAELNIAEKTVENQMGKAIKLLRGYAAAHPEIIFIFVVLIKTFKNL